MEFYFYHNYWKYKEFMTGIIVVSILIFARRDSYEIYNCLDVLLSWAIKTPCLNYLKIWNVVNYNVRERSFYIQTNIELIQKFIWGIKMAYNIGAIFFTTPIICHMRWRSIDHQVKTFIKVKTTNVRSLEIVTTFSLYS